MSATTAEVCMAHRSHAPTPTYSELHHVIPQAWQAFWRPPGPWPNGGPSPDRRGLLLFDARTVPLCRTGHGNVHHWLVEVMRAYARLGNLGEAEHETRAAARARHEHVGVSDFAVACQAPERFVAAGGSLEALVAAKLWGEI